VISELDKTEGQPFFSPQKRNSLAVLNRRQHADEFFQKLFRKIVTVSNESR
jgi:hypothetical protein